VLAPGAALEIEDLPAPDAGVVLAASSATVAQDARLAGRIAQTGGALVRHRVDASLDASGASCAIHAATAVRGSSQAHILTRVVHAAGPSRSDQLVKAVLRDSSRASFDGVVTMLKGADGSAATQQDRNLVLAPTARADTRPQLDIRADEVEASHGATVGALDEDELTYLRARGLAAGDARDLLTRAFLDEVLLGFDPAAQAGGLLHAV
jgi:Fe-S cluster assembly protein SufD